jgi:DMSO/TMAO reductase YedYZ molybdopterin-dependent catalytic subunit
MKKKKRVEFPLILIYIAIIMLVIFASILFFSKIGQEIKEAKSLGTVEIREYEGKKLSSVDDFRENSIKGPQYIDKENYTLQIVGLVRNPINYSYEEVLEYPGYKKVVTLYCVEGWQVTILWEGVLVRDLINKAGPLSNAKTIIFYAEDGYHTSFPTDYIMKNDIIMAYAMNNMTLLPERGFPFQLVAESKWGYKWIKWITKIELSDQYHLGYWESRGYSQSGDLDKSFRGF